MYWHILMYLANWNWRKKFGANFTPPYWPLSARDRKLWKHAMKFALDTYALSAHGSWLIDWFWHSRVDSKGLCCHKMSTKFRT